MNQDLNNEQNDRNPNPHVYVKTTSSGYSKKNKASLLGCGCLCGCMVSLLGLFILPLVLFSLLVSVVKDVSVHY